MSVTFSFYSLLILPSNAEMQNAYLELVTQDDNSVFSLLNLAKGWGWLFLNDEGRLPVAEWLDDTLDGTPTYTRIAVEGQVFEIASFQAMIHTLIEKSVSIIDELTFNHARVKHVNLRSIKDSMNDSTAGYSFFDDKNNKEMSEIAQEVRILGILSLTVAHSSETQSDNDDPTYDYCKVRDYLNRTVELFKILVFLYHLTAGQPGRATELQRMQMSNMLNRKRNLYMWQGELFTLARYNKTDNLSDKRKNIFRFLHPKVGDLLFQYLAFIRPLEG